MLRAGEMVVIVGASLVLTGGVMWTRSVAAGTETASAVPATARLALQSEPAAQKPIRVVHPGYVRRPAEEGEPQRWVDPYRIRRMVERQPAR